MGKSKEKKQHVPRVLSSPYYARLRIDRQEGRKGVVLSLLHLVCAHQKKTKKRSTPSICDVCRLEEERRNQGLDRLCCGVSVIHLGNSLNIRHDARERLGQNY